MHVRELIKKNFGTEIEEVAPGEAEVNISGTLAGLKEVGYKGFLFVEYIPSIPWEGKRELLANVRAIIFIKALPGKD